MADVFTMTDSGSEFAIDIKQIVGYLREGDKYTVYTSAGPIQLNKDRGSNLVKLWKESLAGNR